MYHQRGNLEALTTHVVTTAWNFLCFFLFIWRGMCHCSVLCSLCVVWCVCPIRNSKKKKKTYLERTLPKFAHQHIERSRCFRQDIVKLVIRIMVFNLKKKPHTHTRAHGEQSTRLNNCGHIFNCIRRKWIDKGKNSATRERGREEIIFLFPARHPF